MSIREAIKVLQQLRDQLIADLSDEELEAIGVALRVLNEWGG